LSRTVFPAKVATSDRVAGQQLATHGDEPRGDLAPLVNRIAIFQKMTCPIEWMPGFAIL
jgi:hypothetical protein